MNDGDGDVLRTLPQLQHRWIRHLFPELMSAQMFMQKSDVLMCVVKR